MLSTSNFEEKRGCARISEREREEGKLYEGRPIEEVRKVLGYAKNTYNCRFSEEFVKKMCKISLRRWIPSERHIDAVFAEWKLWEPYVTPESFNDFMLHEIETLFTIYTTTTFFSKNLRGYIGQKATVVKDPLQYMVTTIYKSCKLTLNLKEVEFDSPQN